MSLWKISNYSKKYIFTVVMNSVFFFLCVYACIMISLHVLEYIWEYDSGCFSKWFLLKNILK